MPGGLQTLPFKSQNLGVGGMLISSATSWSMSKLVIARGMWVGLANFDLTLVREHLACILAVRCDFCVELSELYCSFVLLIELLRDEFTVYFTLEDGQVST